MVNTTWRALDHCDDHRNTTDAEFSKEAEQVVKTKQESHEWIIVRGSEGVTVHTTDTQIAASLQLAIQAAIAAVISITVLDDEQGKAISQDLKQFMKTKQRNSQKTIIDNCKNVYVKTTDTDIAVNIQLLLQVLVAIVAKIDIL